MVTTTVETALEELEAVPCWRWDAGTVWMRTCSQKERRWADGQRPAASMTAWGREQPEPRQGPGPYLRGLTLLLELLQLLGREEADRLVARDELRARRHGSEDDVAAQPTEAVGKRCEARPRPGDPSPGLTGLQSEIPPSSSCHTPMSDKGAWCSGSKGSTSTRCPAGVRMGVGAGGVCSQPQTRPQGSCPETQTPAFTFTLVKTEPRRPGPGRPSPSAPSHPRV